MRFLDVKNIFIKFVEEFKSDKINKIMNKIKFQIDRFQIITLKKIYIINHQQMILKMIKLIMIIKNLEIKEV